MGDLLYLIIGIAVLGVALLVGLVTDVAAASSRRPVALTSSPSVAG